MTPRIARTVAVLSVLAVAIVVLAPAVQATKVLERYRSNTKELKTECADGGGTYIGSSSGRLGVCAWSDGTISTCDNKRKGNNCNTQGRVVTDDGQFLDFVEVAVADTSAVTVVTPDDTGEGGAEQGRSSKKLIRRLLAEEDFTMTMADLETKCTNVIEADLIKRNDGSIAVCMGASAAIFCASETGEESCTIEAPKKKLIRTTLQLLRRALVDPSSVEIVVPPGPAAPPSTPGSSTTSTTVPPTTTSSSTTTTSEPGPSIL